MTAVATVPRQKGPSPRRLRARNASIQTATESSAAVSGSSHPTPTTPPRPTELKSPIRQSGHFGSAAAATAAAAAVKFVPRWTRCLIGDLTLRLLEEVELVERRSVNL